MFAYILDSVYSDVIDTESMTDKERIEFLLDAFFEEMYKYYRREMYKYYRRGMSTFELLREWLQGLPSAIKVAFSDYDIAATGKSLGYCKDARSESRFINNWGGILASNILRLARIYEIDMARFY